MSQISPGYSPPLIKQKRYYQHGSKSEQVPRYPLLHFRIIARQYLNDHFPGKWIGRNGSVEWPPRSPDLNPIDFYHWGHVKSEVYSTPVTNVDELWERIVATFGAIRNRPGQLERVRESMMRRLNVCVAANGQHFEQLM